MEKKISPKSAEASKKTKGDKTAEATRQATSKVTRGRLTRHWGK